MASSPLVSAFAFLQSGLDVCKTNHLVVCVRWGLYIQVLSLDRPPKTLFVAYTYHRSPLLREAYHISLITNDPDDSSLFTLHVDAYQDCIFSQSRVVLHIGC
jgi:hypothetical protein